MKEMKLISRLLTPYKSVLPMNPVEIFQSFIRTFLDREITVIERNNDGRFMTITESYPQGTVVIEVLFNITYRDYQYDFIFFGNWDYQDRINLKNLYQQFDRDNKTEVISGVQLWFEHNGFVPQQ